MTTIPPPKPRHGINELLRLVGAVRHLAFDRSLPPSEALGRIRDAFADYDAGSWPRGTPDNGTHRVMVRPFVASVCEQSVKQPVGEAPEHYDAGQRTGDFDDRWPDPPAGWYPDNSVDAPAGQQRYWDGAAWTEQTTTAPATVQPTVAEPAPIPARRTNVAAVVSLIFGILWIFWLGSLVAVIAGHIARSQIKRTGEAGDGAAIAGLILGYLGLVTFGFWLLLLGVGLLGTMSVSG